MSDSEKLEEFYTDCKKDLEKKNTSEGEYCVVITAGKAGYSGRPRFIYKDLEQFKQKAIADIAKIDSMFFVDMQLWIFD